MMTADHSLDLSSFDNTCLPDFDSTVCDNTTPSTLSQTSDSAERVQPTNHNVQSYHSLNNLDQVPLLCPNHNAETSTAISSPAMSKYSSSSSAATHGRGGARKKSPSSPRANAVERRRNNTLAARRYRQKRLDHIEELETALASTSQERDDLKVKVARLEGELAGLRELLKAKAQS
ncbi:hypothetical protein DH86_00003279 [Scytalidium sp. 3C]|nr:hypothetical protein DH86_00003279 [Scytalidium sp. 3C]